jgi:murein DD-endopeptidase MepM/ murein hydrolase activator NlpD
MAGHRLDEHHGDSILASQNFAYDLGVIGSDGATLSGDPALNASYHAHGRPILAAAPGEVVRLHDGVAENKPVGRRPTWRAILRRPLDVAGNHVVVRHAAGEHTAYLHLMPGIPVEIGDRVAAGQVIGRCGNSGNSLESHLHFQLQDGPDLLRASGLPARFEDFTVHLGHLRLYVPPSQPQPLPSRLLVEPGRTSGAVPYREVISP